MNMWNEYGFRHLSVKIFSASVVLLLVAFHSYLQVSEAPITKDAGQNLRMGLNFAHHGIISLDEVEPYHPSMYREPIPVLASAVSIALIDLGLGEAPADAYFSGSRAKLVKEQNVLWNMLLVISAFWATWVLTSSFYTSLFGAAAVFLPIPLLGPWGGPNVDSLYTDLPAAVFLVLGSAFFAHGVRKGSFISTGIAGGFFGVLALTKAAFFYVFVVIAAIALLFGIFMFIKNKKNQGLWHAVTLTVLFLAVVAPWIIRNEVQLGSYAISDRASLVLYIRAVKNTMTSEEAWGAIYYWAHPDIRGFLKGFMGYSSADTDFGGHLQRLNRSQDSSFAKSDLQAELDGRPNDAISFYRQARAERVRLIREFRSANTKNPEAEADHILQNKAFKMIAESPGRHLAMTGLFVWRGAFLVSLILVGAYIFAIVNKRLDVMVMVLPAAGLVAFYALLTHFIPRYGEPMIPVATVLATVMVRTLLERFINFWIRVSKNDEQDHPASLHA